MAHNVGLLCDGGNNCKVNPRVLSAAIAKQMLGEGMGRKVKIFKKKCRKYLHGILKYHIFTVVKQTNMKLFKYNELETVTVDENFNNDNYSTEVDNALDYGFDENFPIVVDEDGLIIDGNHRFTAFQAADRLDEVVFCIVNYFDYTDLVSSLIDQNLNDKFNKDNEFFYKQIKTIAK